MSVQGKYYFCCLGYKIKSLDSQISLESKPVMSVEVMSHFDGLVEGRAGTLTRVSDCLPFPLARFPLLSISECLLKTCIITIAYIYIFSKNVLSNQMTST